MCNSVGFNIICPFKYLFILFTLTFPSPHLNLSYPILSSLPYFVKCCEIPRDPNECEFAALVTEKSPIKIWYFFVKMHQPPDSKILLTAPDAEDV